MPRLTCKATLAAWVVGAGLLLNVPAAHAAVVFSANIPDPERSLKAMFPQMIGFKAKDLTKVRHGSKSIDLKLVQIIQSPLDPVFDSPHTPYTFYTIDGNSGPVGVVVGINQRTGKGERDAMQIFVAINNEGGLHDLHVERMHLTDMAPFRAAQYRVQLRQFSLRALPDEAYFQPPASEPNLAAIKAHQWILRGVRMALVLYAELYRRGSTALN